MSLLYSSSHCLERERTMVRIVHCSLIIHFLLFFNGGMSEIYHVGDEEGWNSDTNFASWSQNYNFTKGDFLVFNYRKNGHNVYEVTEETYGSCNVSRGILGKYESGNDEIQLKEVRKYWFICNVIGHCLDGMRLWIEVKESNSSIDIDTPLIQSPPPIGYAFQLREKGIHLHWRSFFDLTGLQMAGKGNVRSDCKHASNPYHVCSEYCSDKTGESKTHKARKHSGYDGDGALKYNGEKKNTVRPDCTKASNPYHDCNEFCSNKTTQGDRPEAKRDSGSVVIDTTKTIGGKRGSRPKPPREIDVALSSAVSTKPQTTNPRVSPKIDSRNSDRIEPYSERTRFVEDPLPIEEKKKFSQLVLVSGNVPMADNLQDPHKKDASKTSSVTLRKDIDVKPRKFPEMVQIPAVRDKEDGAHATASPNITGFHLPGVIPGYAESEEEEEEEEIKSVSSESSVSIGKYHVKRSFASILQSVFNKHGDIAASCKLESSSICSYYLECVCYIVQELQCTKLPQMSKSKVRELLAILKDIESSEINVGWLHCILNELAEAVEFSSQHSNVEEAKANCERELESTKKELESQMKELTLKEKEVADVKAEVADTKARLSELEFKYFQLNEAISSVRLKVNNLQCEAMTDELL